MHFFLGQRHNMNHTVFCFHLLVSQQTIDLHKEVIETCERSLETPSLLNMFS